MARVKSRAKKFGLDCNLTIEDIVIPVTCPVLGIILGETPEGKAADNSPSVDRLDNSRGYVKGNIHVISWRANRLKSDATLEETMRIYKYMCKVERAAFLDTRKVVISLDDLRETIKLHPRMRMSC